MLTYPPHSKTTYSPEAEVIAVSESSFVECSAPPRGLLIFGASVFLVSVPVFFEAPLVRSLPLLCLMLTSVWVWLSIALSAKPHTKHWGELLTGFTWTWLAGSLYWGWMRWEPTLHLPIEAIGLPIAIWGLRQNWCKLGNFFYLGSLFGTALTDLYFYLTDLIPYWRKLMQVEPDAVQPVFQQALIQMYTPSGIFWVIVLAASLLIVGMASLRMKTAPWIAFGGAVLSTILVDSLFWVAATLA
ncbi:DUF3120 domain-containing protein [Cyanobacteria bacterium FACHB-DQ100]|nr:DUF3120 domain-containing protein [Leptolyngbya sp. FACHB-17]MBD1822370.1 DUF3120 domain-containing protein [Cyanobacteria bacterium FACHB-DQ100]MBD2081121.1 DUF3120 domain-containing protein [Leptolyngbya sp. FACHB-17]